MQEETSESMPDPPTPGQLNPNELQQLFELAPFGIGVFDRYFRCRSVNQMLADINGLSREDHYGKYLRDIVPTLAPVLEPLFQQIISSGIPQVELSLSGQTEAHQGQQRRWQAIYSPMLDEQGTPDGILTIVRDVTEQYEVQQRLQLAMSAGQIGVWEWHVAEDRLQFDGQVERLLGTAANQFQGGMDNFIKRFDPVSGEQLRTALNGTAPLHLTLSYLGPNQMRGWVDLHADHVAATGTQGRRIMGVIHDATDRCNQEDKLRQANVVFDTTAEGIIIMDGQRQIISVNPAFCNMTQYEPDEIVGKSPEAIMHPRRHTDIDYPWHTLLPGSHAWHGEMMCLRKDGDYFTSWQHVSAVYDSRHNTAHYVITFSDISAIRKAEAQLNHLAYHDPLTELGNRNLLQERLELEIKTAQLNRQQLALLFIDLDGFKLINDNLGHRAGDQLLKLLAGRIRQSLRHNDVAIRLGGDEFLVLIPYFEQQDELAQLAEQLLARLREPVELEHEQVAISASIGIALYPEHARSPDALVSAADNAMYEAKSQGRNGYLFYSPDMAEQTRERMSMEQGLLKAIDQHQLCILYQPMTDLANNRLSGLEALLRWQHPSEGMIAPARFIPVAEECGLIEQIGEWVMRTACQQGQAWLTAGLAVPRLSVNVSVREMRAIGYVERVAAILAETGFPAERLEIEVTESIIQRVDHSLQLFTRLKALGVQIAIDDFGTGFSSLSLLKSLPIDRIKIDQTFVQALPDDKHSRELCRTIINLADSLGMAVTAEGIETQAQRQFLQSLHCQEGQGYLFSHPLTEPHLAAQLTPRKGVWC
ncbi:GGDEF/EAL domain-containing protein [Aeromonas salmonicida]|uniref:sensor domain-containing protein n=1 Tax=Aeromonas salmonicida TaxID=645 RepID=UPI001026D72F|nr:EAL domain-containing protein [Aeromonas salmonicida]VFB08320.1 GGDEF/EAL domain-containing protein [Aeromonas salmonicida]